MNWAEDTLFMKARLYMTRAFEEVRRDDPLFGFWATLGMELLGRAVLASVHPALLADPSEPENLFYALGYEVKAPKSIPVKAVFSRCQRIIPEFTEANRDQCMALVYLRNEEVHTGGLPFEELPTEAWLPGFFHDCELLLGQLGRTLDDLFGPEEARAAKQMMVEVDKKLRGDIQKRIGLSKNDFEQATDQADRRTTAARRIWQQLRERGTDAKERPCPACGTNGILSGEVIRSSEPRLTDASIVVERAVVATGFICYACPLVLADQAELNAAGIGGQFSTEENYEPLDYYREQFEEAYFEPDYGND